MDRRVPVLAKMTILTVTGLFPCYHGDVTRMINSRYCVVALCVLAAVHVAMVSIYYRAPIECFCPAHDTEPQCSMKVTSCLSSATSMGYRLQHQEIPRGKIEPDRIEIGPFYRFACIVLLLQASMFYVPCVISRELRRLVGVQLDEMSLTALEARRSRDVEEREAAVKDLAAHIYTFCSRQLRQRHAAVAFRCFYGSQLHLLEVFVRMLYAANVIGQFYLLDFMLGVSFHDLGWAIIGKMPLSITWLDWHTKWYSVVNGTDVTVGLDDIIDKTGQDDPVETNIEEPMFPQTFLCDVMVRSMGNVHRYTLQCVLPINQLNEMIYQYVWFLLFGTAIVTMTSLFLSIFRLVMYPCRRMTTRDRLFDLGQTDLISPHGVDGPGPTGPETLQEDPDVSTGENDPNPADYWKKVNIFEKEFLCMDGLLLLSHIEAGSGDVIRDSTLSVLWRMYKDDPDVDSLSRPMKRKETFIEEDTFTVPITSPATHVHERQPLSTFTQAGNSGSYPGEEAPTRPPAYNTLPDIPDDDSKV